MLPRFSPSVSTTHIECCWCSSVKTCSGEKKFKAWLNREINYSCNWYMENRRMIVVSKVREDNT